MGINTSAASAPRETRGAGLIVGTRRARTGPSGRHVKAGHPETAAIAQTAGGAPKARATASNPTAGPRERTEGRGLTNRERDPKTAPADPRAGRRSQAAAHAGHRPARRTAAPSV